MTLFGNVRLLRANVVLRFMGSSAVPFLLKLKLLYGVPKAHKVLTPGGAVSYAYIPIHYALIPSQYAAFVSDGLPSLLFSPNQFNRHLL